MNQAEIQAEEIAVRLCAFLRDNILAPDVAIAPDTDLNLIGVDSFSLMEIILFIERCYGLVLPPESLTPENITSIDSLSRYCASRLNQTDV